MKEKLIEYFIENNFKSIKDTNETWDTLGKKFDMTGEAARNIWKRYRLLNLKSRWQVQAKGGEIKWLESYKTDDIKINFDELLAVFKSLNFTEPIIKTYPVFTEKGVTVCHLSDKHIGAIGTKENPYNADVFEKRMDFVYDKLTNNITDKLIITDLGDALDTNGLNLQTVRGGHNLETNLDNTQIFETYLKVHKKFLNNLLKVFKEIDYYHVYRSNHDGNFSYFCVRALQIACPQVNIHICEDNFTTFPVENFNYIITHGKDDKYQNKHLPYDINATTQNYIMNYIMQKNLTNVRFYKGDLHRYGVSEVANFTYINIPSVFGSSNYGSHNFIPVKPGFVIEHVQGNNICTSKFNFY